MCGIVASLTHPVQDVLTALRQLEHRGYDSHGLAVLGQEGWVVHKGLGPIPADLDVAASGPCLAHVRWATHGKVCLENTHPIFSYTKDSAVAHNGVVDNYLFLREELKIWGWPFSTETDTEVIANFLDGGQEGGFLCTLTETARELEGDFAFVALSLAYPDLLGGVVRGAPLLLSDDGMLASDPEAFAGRSVAYVRLPDGCAFTLSKGRSARLVDLTSGKDVPLPSSHQSPPARAKPVQDSVMRAEIGEQPALLRAIHNQPPSLVFPSQAVLFGCGSSYHAALLGRWYFEEIAFLRAEAFHSTDLAERRCPYEHANLMVALTQSGETKDTIRALERVRSSIADPNTVCLTNVSDSQASAIARQTVLLGAGMERAVAATKTFTMSVAHLFLWAASWADRRGWQAEVTTVLPDAIDRALAREQEVVRLASQLTTYRHALVLARGLHMPIALEAALKLKEVACLHAEAMHAAEMKHGPIALIDDETASLFLVGGEGKELTRILANMREIKARKGKVFAFAEERAVESIGDAADYVIAVPSTANELTQPLVTVVMCQLLAYHLAVLRGLNPDRPRNLAKTITVE